MRNTAWLHRVCPWFQDRCISETEIKFEIVVSSEDWEIKVIDAVQKAAFTGDPGDGKIFSYEIRNAVRIRTGETGYDALQSEFL